jgi:hypothetical protein
VVVKAVLICALLMALGSYLVYLKTGRFWIPSFAVASLIPSTKHDSPNMSPLPKLNELEKSGLPVYKWIQDGQWHYGDSPPNGVDAQIVSGDEK